MIEEEIEAAENELKDFQRENKKDIKRSFISGILLSGAAVATAATLWMTPNKSYYRSCNSNNTRYRCR